MITCWTWLTFSGEFRPRTCALGPAMDLFAWAKSAANTVTAANAGKVLFMREAAISFLKYTRKENGNELERSVFQKLQNPLELAHLKADAIMFHHVYCDLVMLAKSTSLNKNVLDMNKHYLELQTFLSEIECYPEAAMD